MPQRLLKFLAPLFVACAAALAYALASGTDPVLALKPVLAGWAAQTAKDAGIVVPVPSEPAAPATVPAVLPEAAASSSVALNAAVVRAVDGDTVEARLDGAADAVKVRLLGVNTPESVDPRRPVECFGKEASRWTKERLEGKRVRLEPDPEADEHDKYGRILRRVVLPDGSLFNLLLVQEGYAQAYTSFPMNAGFKRDLKMAEQAARTAGKGLWSPTTCAGGKEMVK